MIADASPLPSSYSLFKDCVVVNFQFASAQAFRFSGRLFLLSSRISNVFQLFSRAAFDQRRKTLTHSQVVSTLFFSFFSRVVDSTLVSATLAVDVDQSNLFRISVKGQFEVFSSRCLFGRCQLLSAADENQSTLFRFSVKYCFGIFLSLRFSAEVCCVANLDGPRNVSGHTEPVNNFL